MRIAGDTVEAVILVSCSVCKRLHTPKHALAAHPICPACLEKTAKKARR